MLDDMVAAVTNARRDQLIEEARQWRRVTDALPARGRHRRIRQSTGPVRAARATAGGLPALSRRVAAAMRSLREAASADAVDPALPRVRDYPLAQRR